MLFRAFEFLVVLIMYLSSGYICGVNNSYTASNKKRLVYAAAVIISCLVSILPSYSQINTDSVDVDTCAVFQLGNKKVNIVNYHRGSPHIKFLVIHDNEDTGVKAALNFIRGNGGSLIDLQYGAERNIVFSDTVNTYQFDPNTMFTGAGAYRGLDKYTYRLLSPNAPPSIIKLGQAVLACYNPDSLGYIVTLHNNSDGAFSIQSYREQNYLKTTASQLYINDQMDPDDLAFVTDSWFFNYLKQQNINVILQSKEAADDGSLSVYAEKRNIPYVNIEVQHGHIDEHYRLIEVVNQMLKEYGDLKKRAKKN